MSHDSGFRRGGQDFTHKPPPRSAGRPPRTRKADRAAERRFHEHEREQLEPNEPGPDED